MEIDVEFEIYRGKKFSSLLKDIVLNSADRNDTIQRLIDDLRQMVKTPNDAIMIIPLIREYLDVTVKNDEQLVKLAAIIQRLAASNQSAKDGDDVLELSDEDRKQLYSEANSIVEEIKKPLPTQTIPTT
jgi:hypothetical protein